MRRLLLNIVGSCLMLIVLGVGGIINRSLDRRSGPVHRFSLPAGESFLADAVARLRDVTYTQSERRT